MNEENGRGEDDEWSKKIILIKKHKKKRMKS